MGADLIAAFCKWPADAEGKPLPASQAVADQVKSRLVDWLAAQESPESLESVNLYLDWDEEETELDWRGFVVEKFSNEIDALFGGVGYIRDVCGVNLGGGEYIFTAGMSWGDYPTDSFEAISFLGCTEITMEAF